MSDSTSRVGFEAWAKSYSPDIRLDRVNHGSYVSGITHSLYCAWIASRDSLVIDLPESFDKYDSGEFMYWAEDVDKAIEAAGVRIKP